MREPLFDLSAEYEQMLNQGIRLSGEDRYFFLAGRVRYLMGILPVNFVAKRILDFGFQRHPVVRSLFYFPRFLAWFRAAEAVLDRLPLGAQYCVLAQKPPVGPRLPVAGCAREESEEN